jgi:hypothetical protein
MRQARTAKVCIDLAKSARFTVPVPSTVGFDRLLLTLSTICRCPIRSTESKNILVGVNSPHNLSKYRDLSQLPRNLHEP